MERKFTLIIVFSIIIGILFTVSLIIFIAFPVTKNSTNNIEIAASDAAAYQNTLSYGERIIYEFTSNVSINAYVLDYNQYLSFVYSGSGGNYLQKVTGTSGSLDYTQNSLAGGTIIVWFETSSQAANVSYTMTAHLLGLYKYFID